MINFPCFQREEKSHLCQENCKNTAWNSKVWQITSPASRRKTKAIYVKKMGETWFEIANIYAWLPLLPQQKQKSFMPREKQKYRLKWQSVINKFFYFKNENKNHLFQENGENIEWNSKVWRIASPASRTKTEVIYVLKKAETWIEIAKGVE